MDGKHSELFQEFRDYCLQCYAIVRRKASLFMILFGMMVSTGIPELRSTSDLEYLRTALAVGMTEDQVGFARGRRGWVGLCVCARLCVGCRFFFGGGVAASDSWTCRFGFAGC